MQLRRMANNSKTAIPVSFSRLMALIPVGRKRVFSMKQKFFVANAVCAVLARIPRKKTVRGGVQQLVALVSKQSALAR
eukprot:4321072-Pleurochrysis_carterae.AAC.2